MVKNKCLAALEDLTLKCGDKEAYFEGTTINARAEQMFGVSFFKYYNTKSMRIFHNQMKKYVSQGLVSRINIIRYRDGFIQKLIGYRYREE